MRAVYSNALQSTNMRHLGLVFLSVAVLGTSACKQRTQIMIGVLTDLRAPGVMDEVQLDVSREGVPVLQQAWILPGVRGEPFILPGSFGLYDPNGRSLPVSIQLTGFLHGQPKVIRHSLVSLVPDQTLFLRMGLTAQCLNRFDCPQDQTCVEGACKPRLVATATLPKFVDGMERQISCNSGTTFIDTSTSESLPVTGGGCATTDGRCEEGTCYLPDTTGGQALWQAETIPLQSPMLQAVAASGGATMDVYSVGANGAVLHRKYATAAEAAQGWVDESIGNDNLTAVAVDPTDGNQAWAVGDGVAWHRNAQGTWLKVAIPNNPTLFAVAYNGSTAYLVGRDKTLTAGSDGVIYVSPDGVMAILDDVFSGPELHAVGFDVQRTAYVAGAQGSVYRQTGATWTALTARGTNTFQAMAFRGFTAVAADNVGTLTTINTSDGSVLGKFSVTGANAGQPLNSVTISQSGRAVAVGPSGLIVSSTDLLNWNVEQSPATNTLRGVFGTAIVADERFYIVGDGTMLSSRRASLPGQPIPDAGQPFDAGMCTVPDMQQPASGPCASTCDCAPPNACWLYSGMTTGICCLVRGTGVPTGSCLSDCDCISLSCKGMVCN